MICGILGWVMFYILVFNFLSGLIFRINYIMMVIFYCYYLNFYIKFCMCNDLKIMFYVKQYIGFMIIVVDLGYQDYNFMLFKFLKICWFRKKNGELRIVVLIILII